MVESHLQRRRAEVQRRQGRSGASSTTARASPTPASAGTTRCATLETLSEAVARRGRARRRARDAGAALTAAAAAPIAPCPARVPVVASCSPPAQRRRRSSRCPAIAAGRAACRAMTDGPFYPAPSLPRPRARLGRRPHRRSAAATPTASRCRAARGEHLDLHGIVRDGDGRAIDGADDRDLAVRRVRQLSPSARRRRPRRRRLPGLRQRPAATPAAATASAPSGRCRIRAGRRTSTSSCGTRRSASSPRSCSSPASRATPGDFLYRSLVGRRSRGSRDAAAARPGRRAR